MVRSPVAPPAEGVIRGPPARAPSGRRPSPISVSSPDAIQRPSRNPTNTTLHEENIRCRENTFPPAAPSLEALEDRLCLSSLPTGTTLAQPDAATQARLSAAYGQLPLSFEANQGQTDSRVNFLSRGAGYSLFLTPTKAVLSLKQGDTSNVVGMRLVGANPASRAVGLDKQAGVSNYLIGNDPSKWHTDVPNYAEVAYKGVYRGIDLVYHGDQKQLEYDFVVRPGADPRAIRLAFDGTQGKSLDAQGNLVLHTSGGDVVEHAPVAYQTINGVRHAVASRFVLDATARWASRSAATTTASRW